MKIFSFTDNMEMPKPEIEYSMIVGLSVNTDF